MRQDLEPALDTPGISDAPNFDGVRRQFGGFEAGRHHNNQTAFLAA